MTHETSTWRDLFKTGGLAIFVIFGGTSLQAIEAFIASAMLPTVVADIGGIELFAWNTTIFILASIVATLFAAVRPRSIGPRGGYMIAAGAFAAGSLLCGLAPSMIVLLAGRFVQGFGAGLLIAQSIAMYRIVFPERLWPRLMALNATIWGVGTVVGPALGGTFAEIGLWRWAFLGIVPIAALLAFGALRVLPQASESRPPSRMPLEQVLLVTAIVLLISIASLLTEAPAIAWVLVGLGIAGIALLGLVDARSRSPLLPDGTFSPMSPMSGLFGLILLLGVVVTCDIFAPLFFQTVHGLSPLWAGYFTALVAAGWSISAITTAGWTGVRVTRMIVVAPALMCVSVLGLAHGFSAESGAVSSILVASIALFGLGVGIGPAFQQLSARVLATTTAADNDRTSAALGMVQLFASGFGAAIGGVAVNAAGLPLAQTPMEVASVAKALFLTFALIAAAGVPLALSVARRDARSGSDGQENSEMAQEAPGTRT
jgi:MFS family permease